jgi:hypothetical protein
LTIVVASSHKGVGQSRAESEEPVGVTSGSGREGSSPASDLSQSVLFSHAEVTTLIA